jgi:ubiquinone/menaquinone biosynthesis C-methylase UbiE
MLDALVKPIKYLSKMLSHALGGRPPSVSIHKIASTAVTPVDVYWGEHTVNSVPFQTAEESLQYLQWRAEQYPLFQEFMQLYGDHNGQTILDYGCGPGNDLVGFLAYTKAKKVVGIDISEKALTLARHRLALHHFDPERVELLQLADAVTNIPIDDQKIDYIYCEGVLHHTSNPQDIIKEFHRILKPSSYACLMVYNYDSLWLHLYTAYQKMILEGAFPGMDIYGAFSKNTDGEACPISRCYKPEEFMAVCREAGFAADFVGGYFSLHELKLYESLQDKALGDERLAKEHREFLRDLVADHRGWPQHRGKYAGIGGVYMLFKNNSKSSLIP